MICNRCGKDNPDSYKFCEHCGCKMTEELTSEEMELLSLSEQNEKIISDFQEKINEQNEKKKMPLWKDLLITMFVAIILGIICLLCFGTLQMLLQ